MDMHIIRAFADIKDRVKERGVRNDKGQVVEKRLPENIAASQMTNWIKDICVIYS